MRACPHCGLENLPDNQFCIGCGKAMAEASSGGEGAGLGVVCQACDTYNEPGRQNCVKCGQPISGLTSFFKMMTPAGAGAASPAPAPAAAGPVLTVPPPVGVRVPSAPLATQPELSAAPRARVPEAPATPPAEAPRQRRSTGQMPAAVAQEDTSEICPFCKAKIPVASTFCLACGQTLRAETPEPALVQDTSIRLRLVRGFGREDATFPIGPGGITIGRSQAVVTIPEDPFLAPLHLTLRPQDGGLMLEDPGSFNGVFLRLRGRAEIRQGAEFIAGTQRLQLLGLGGPTTDGRTASKAGETRPYGGPVPRQLYIALRTLHAGPDRAVLGGPVLLRAGPVVSVGQLGCDINFPSDSRMSARHVELQLKPAGLELVDLGAPGGVFLRVRAPVALLSGDELLLGEEVFRVEMG